MPAPLRPQKPTVPYFYKYSSAEYLNRLESIILKHELYFPTTDQLNDPAEGKPKLAQSSLDQITKLLLDTFIKNNPGLAAPEYERAKQEIQFNAPRYGTDVLLKRMGKTLNLELQSFRIYSLSKRYDNNDLWTKYAVGESGYCLEFANDGLFSKALEVTYDSTFTLDVTDPTQVKANFFFYKSLEWSKEEEVRILAPRGSPPKIQFDPTLLTRLILGKNMSAVHRSKIQSWADQRTPKLVVVNIGP